MLSPVNAVRIDVIILMRVIVPNSMFWGNIRDLKKGLSLIFFSEIIISNWYIAGWSSGSLSGS